MKPLTSWLNHPLDIRRLDEQQLAEVIKRVKRSYKKWKHDPQQARQLSRLLGTLDLHYKLLPKKD